MEKNENISEELEDQAELAGDTAEAPEDENTDELEEADAVSALTL